VPADIAKGFIVRRGELDDGMEVEENSNHQAEDLSDSFLYEHCAALSERS
jgi:hypothetical protein